MRAKHAAPQRAHGAANRVRIIGGQYRRRLLDFPGSAGLRPSPDRVRETLFNWLGQDLPGWACLDLFAGSGALAVQASTASPVIFGPVTVDGEVVVAVAVSGLQEMEDIELAQLGVDSIVASQHPE